MAVLFQHKESHFYTSKQCQKTFKLKKEYLKHKSSEHTNKKQIDNSREILVGNSKITCHSRGQMLKYKLNVKPRIRIKCKVCRESFSSKEEMLVHKESSDNCLIWKCSTCSDSFGTRKDMSIHIKQTHFKDKRKAKAIQTKCNVCLEIFRSQTDMLLHKKEKHHGQRGKGKKTLHCSLCDFIGKGDVSVFMEQMEHMLTHLNDPKKRNNSANLEEYFEEQETKEFPISTDEIKTDDVKDNKKLIKSESIDPLLNPPKNSEIKSENSKIKQELVNVNDTINDNDKAAVEPGGASYVCPLDSCTYFTKILNDNLMSEHYNSCHPGVDTTNVQFLTLL